MSVPSARPTSDDTALDLGPLPHPRARHPRVREEGPFRTGVVVLDDQLAALRAVARLSGFREPGRSGPWVPAPSGASMSPSRRNRILELAVQVLTQAALSTEAQCRRIVADAEARAAALVDEAHAEVARVTSWLEPVGEPPGSPEPVDPIAALADIADSDSEVAALFFGVDPTTDEEAWRFLDDDLVAVGPPFLKLMRRRPPPRPHAGT